MVIRYTGERATLLARGQISLCISGFSSWPHTRLNTRWIKDMLFSPWAALVAQVVKNLPVMLETWVRSLSQEDPLEKEMATNSRILAWEIPRTEEPGGLQFMGHKVSHMTEWLSHHLWSSLYQILPLDNSCFASTVLWIEHESFCIFVSISSCRRHRIYLLINKGNAGSQNILICINWLPV